MQVLGIGTDIVECLRIAQMIERHGELFIGRVYTDHEIEYCRARKAATQHYAGRWAAKEAVMKAWAPAGGGARLARYRSPQLPRRQAGHRHARRCRDLIESIGMRELLISISHCRSHATAYAIALGEKRDEREEWEDEDWMSGFLVLGLWFLVLGSWFLVLGLWFLEVCGRAYRVRSTIRRWALYTVLLLFSAPESKTTDQEPRTPNLEFANQAPSSPSHIHLIPRQYRRRRASPHGAATWP